MNSINVLEDIFKQFKGPKFSVKYWNGEKKCYGTGNDSKFTLCLNRPNVLRRLLAEGALGFGESYMDKTLDIEGDLEEYLRLRHEFKHIKPSYRIIAAKFLAELTKPKRRNSQISYHYDLGNDFFSLFLDKETMSYSAGYFNSTTDLGTAQQNKFNLINDWLKLREGSRVLDLGSGWGGFAVHSARDYGWKIDGKTLSQNQLDYTNVLISKLALGDRVSINYEDFNSLKESGLYDGSVMIEAIEHVAKDKLASFLSRISEKLNPGAPFYIQFTGRYKPKSVDAWTLKYVFPGGHLPSKQELFNAAKQAGFIVEKFEDHTEDYQKTISSWINSIENHQADIERKFGSEFYRLWKLWTHGARVNFDIGDMSLFRVLLRKPLS